jgi:hypothetical protein
MLDVIDHFDWGKMHLCSLQFPLQKMDLTCTGVYPKMANS